MHCLHQYHAYWSLHWISGLLAAHQALCVVRFESEKIRKLVAITVGYLDGVRGRLGTFERRHPRVAAFCKRTGPDPTGRLGGGASATTPGGRLDGTFSHDQLRSALSRVQRKHPALRALIREEPDGLYSEADCAPDIPLRTARRVSEDDCRRECQSELITGFAGGESQLRVVWLQSESEPALLFVTSHRICDGMSVLTIVSEVVRALYSHDDLIPYAPVTTRDIIGDYRPPRPWMRRAIARMANGLLRLIPPARQTVEHREEHLEWRADRRVAAALKQRCKEGVSLHAALLVALDRTLSNVLGAKRSPKWIDSPVDARRWRLTAMKSDMLFFGGGSLKMRTGQASDTAFWTRARAVTHEMRRQIDREMVAMPSRYHFCDMLHPLSSRQLQSIVRLGDILKINGSLNRITLSNFGDVTLGERDAPIHVKDLRLYLHSRSVRLLALVVHGFDGEIHFQLIWDQQCLTRLQASGIQHTISAIVALESGRRGDAV